MKQRTRFMRFTSQVLTICFLLVSFQHVALAGIVSTADIVDTQVAQLDKQKLQALLSQENVRSQLIAMGVDPADAKQRLANMTDDEIQAFSAKMDQLPAGSGVVGTLALIFIILLITDLLGLTDVFPFVKKTVYD